MARSNARRLASSSSVKIDRSNTANRLVQQLALYGVFHEDKRHRLTHAICVTLLLWTVLVWATYFSPKTVQDFSSNTSLLILAIYGTYYVSFDVPVSVVWLICMGIPLWLSATAFRIAVPSAWVWATAVHTISWHVQIAYRHGWFERRRPGLIDAVFHSIMLAPLIVWYEILFALGLCQRAKTRLEERLNVRS